MMYCGTFTAVLQDGRETEVVHDWNLVGNTRRFMFKDKQGVAEHMGKRLKSIVKHFDMLDEDVPDALFQVWKDSGSPNTNSDSDPEYEDPKEKKSPITSISYRTFLHHCRPSTEEEILLFCEEFTLTAGIELKYDVRELDHI